MNPFATTWSVAYLAIELLAIISALHALWHVRTTQATIAWVVGLVSMPLFALPLYWIFGRYRFHGYRESIREVGRRHKRSVAAVNRELKTAPNARTTPLLTPLELMADMLDTPLCDGNDVELLIDGSKFYERLFELIDSAQSYIYLEFYIFRDDEIGNRVADALIRRAADGVKVRVLYDEIGCLRLSGRYVRRLLAGGVDMRAFNTRRGLPNRFQLNFRNHRKLVVVDGQQALVGGLNIGDEYLGKATWTNHWRDTSALVCGPIVKKIQAIFAGDYYWAARHDLPEADWSATNECGSARMALCVTGPADDWPRATMMFASLASAARYRLWISTPYLVPDETCMVALNMACARGVDVRVLAPGVPDQWTVYLAGLYYERELLRAGVSIYRYQPGAMHQKCILCDDRLALVGSTNLDNRSLHLNFEMMVAVDNDSFLHAVSEMLEADFERSTCIHPGDPPSRPWLTRLGRIVARLFSPVL